MVTVEIDGTRPPSPASIAALEAVCDRAEDNGAPGIVVVYVSGAPDDGTWIRELNVALVSKWERTLRRLERVPLPTVAVAAGDCGGTALEALLATDVRIATHDVRLLVPPDGPAPWPGMATFRLVHQVGIAQIRRAVLFGWPVHARAAVAWGLLDELTEDPGAALATAAETLGGYAGSELAIRRQLMFEAAAVSFEDALGAHLAACDRAIRRHTDEAIA
jgi:isomerase DpgB